MTTIEGIVATLNPDQGQGWQESIIAWLFIVGYFMLLLLDKNVPDAVTTTVGIVVSVYFSVHIIQNNQAKP